MFDLEIGRSLPAPGVGGQVAQSGESMASSRTIISGDQP